MIPCVRRGEGRGWRDELGLLVRDNKLISTDAAHYSAQSQDVETKNAFVPQHQHLRPSVDLLHLPFDDRTPTLVEISGAQALGNEIILNAANHKRKVVSIACAAECSGRRKRVIPYAHEDLVGSVRVPPGPDPRPGLILSLTLPVSEHTREIPFPSSTTKGGRIHETLGLCLVVWRRKCPDWLTFPFLRSTLLRSRTLAHLCSTRRSG